MYSFLESICFRSGAYQLLDYHQQRINRTFDHFFPDKLPPDLKKILPALAGHTKKKVRLEYHPDGHDLQVTEYQVKDIKRMKVVESNEIDYDFKYADRSQLHQLFQQRGEADDILIIRDGKVTDSYYANVIFQANDGEWITPKSRLLNGVKRQYLLDRNIIREKSIRLEDMKDYSQVCLINAMLDPGEVVIPTSQIMV